MNLPATLASSALEWTTNLVYVPILLAALWRAPWWHLRCGEDSHVLFAACVALMGIWSIQAGIRPGLELHLLGVTLLTLMFGWQFAVIGSTVVLLVITANSGAGWSSFGCNALLTGILPTAVSSAFLSISRRHLPGNFFVYIFVVAFFGAAAAMVSVALASTALLWLIGVFELSWLVDYYSPYVLLLALPEAFLTGGLLAIFVVYRPQWVASFDDQLYLHDG